MRKTLLFAACAFFSSAVLGQYSIKTTIEGLRAPWAMLGYRIGDKQFRADSVAVDTLTGTALFRGSKRLPEGHFFIGTIGGRLFDLMVDADQDFEIRGKMSALDSLTAIGSLENEAFFEHVRAIGPLNRKIDEQSQFLSMMARATHEPSALKPTQEEIRKTQERITALSKAHLKKWPDRLYSKMLRMGFVIEVPPSIPPRKDGRLNPAFIEHLKAHYFDNVDFSDPRMLYCDVFPNKIAAFLRDLWPTRPDSIAAACDRILLKAGASKEFYRWTIVHLTNMFDVSEWQGAASVFVHLVDRYQKGGQNDWIDAATLERLRYKADAWRPTLLMSPAPLLALKDETGALIDVQSLAGPVTMVVFYSPLCEHCMKEMPGIYQNYLDFAAKGLQCMAVSCDSELENWRAHLKANPYQWHDAAIAERNSAIEKEWAAFNLPVIYLLDKDKKVIARRVNPTQLHDFLSQAFSMKK